MKTAYVHDPLFLRHDTGAGHPERSARLVSVQDMISSQDWYQSLQQLKPKAVDREWIELVHKPGYAHRIQKACDAGKPWIDTPDVAVSPQSCDAALNATGSLLSLVDQVMAERSDNGFASVRPPGHHAEHDMAMGFCLFNSVAIAARYLQHHHGLERVLILDWDVHHGNGTQHTFERDPSVMYISLHQYPHYPGTGAKSETGIGEGEGTVVNCPMSPGLGDAHYRQAFEEIVLPSARNFKPDFILLSAGFDAHYADPLGSIDLTTSSYSWMTKAMMELADQCCEGRLVSVLEGGYDLQALAESVTEHVRVLHQG
ncbi:MAG: histone deacetylase [Arenicellales bacterium]